MNRIILLIVLFTAQVFNLHATAQYGDKLIIDKDTFWIDSNPLEPYLELKGNRKIGNEEMQGGCTALWRGYVATWRLEHDSLFLIRVQTDYCGDNPIDLDIKKEFGPGKIFAEWVDHTIIQTKGELLQYIHMGYMSIYEQEIHYDFKKGQLKNTTAYSYVEMEENALLPVERLLADTLKKIILKSIDITERKKFSADSSCFIQIAFDSNRMISKISMSYAQNPRNDMEKIILSNAIEALKTFPRLMKVKHERYYPPVIDLFFNGHCLLYPQDRKYGCDDE